MGIWVGYTLEGLSYKGNDLAYKNVKEDPFKIYGLYGDENTFHRMPQFVADGISKAVADRHRESSGARVRFATDSSVIAVKATLREWGVRPQMTPMCIAGFSLYEYKDGNQRYLKSFLPPLDDNKNLEGYIKLSGGKMREYVLYLPLMSEVYSLEIGVNKDCLIQEPSEYKYEKPIVFYGSSITHGCAASRPGNSYEGFVSRSLDANYYNLGFSGNAKGEPEMARYIASLDMTAFVLDYDHNANTVDDLKQTHETFFKIIRDSNPDLLIAIVSKPGSLSEYSLSRKDVIVQTYLNARNSNDKKVYFVDGASLFGYHDSDNCTTDGTHPNDLGFKNMSRLISHVLNSTIR